MQKAMILWIWQILILIINYSLSSTKISKYVLKVWIHITTCLYNMCSVIRYIGGKNFAIKEPKNKSYRFSNIERDDQ